MTGDPTSDLTHLREIMALHVAKFDTAIEQLEKRFMERGITDDKAVSVALDNLKTSQSALKAEYDHRLATVNEFVETYKNLTAISITRKEVEAMFNSTRSETDARFKDAFEQIKKNTEQQAALAAAAQGVKSMWAIIASAAGFIGIVIGIYFAIAGREPSPP